MSKALFDALGIEESDAIDDDEIKRIKLLIAKVQVNAANVARENDTDDTIAILDIIHEVVKRLSKHNRFEVEQFWEAIRQGRVPQQTVGSAAALGTGNTPAAPAAPAPQVPDDYEQTKADAVALLKFIRKLIDKGVIPAFDWSNEAQVTEVVNSLFQKHDYAKKYLESNGERQAQPAGSVPKAEFDQKVRENEQLKADLAKAKAEIEKAKNALAAGEGVRLPPTGWIYQANITGERQVNPKTPDRGWLYPNEEAGALARAVNDAKAVLDKY